MEVFMCNKKTLVLVLLSSIITANGLAMEQATTNTKSNPAPRPSSNHCSFEHTMPEFNVPPVNRMKVFAYKAGIIVISYGIAIVTGVALSPVSRAIANTLFPVRFDYDTFELHNGHQNALTFSFTNSVGAQLAGTMFYNRASKALERSLAKAQYNARRKAIAQAWKDSTPRDKSSTENQ
jgi:hypothetical protein